MARDVVRGAVGVLAMSELPSGGPATDKTMLDYFAVHATEADYIPFMLDWGDDRKFEKEHGFWPTRSWAKYEYAADMLAEKQRRETETW